VQRAEKYMCHYDILLKTFYVALVDKQTSRRLDENAHLINIINLKKKVTALCLRSIHNFFFLFSSSLFFSIDKRVWNWLVN
jgi:hypothetical protein